MARSRLRYLYCVRHVAFLGSALVLALALPARAQTGNANNRAAAEALFGEGRSLAASGHFAEACPKFEASQQLDPGLGTLLNLAECYEKLGKTASAWAEYREAIPLARASGSKVRQDLATERAAALESRLSTLTIRRASNQASSTPVEIRRDGVLVQPAELGSAIPLDPGTHTVEATAPGKQKWSSTVEVSGDSSKLTVEIPELTPESATTTAAGPPPTAAARPASSQRTVAVVIGALGVAGVGLGTLFGLQAKSTWSDSKSHCPNYPYGCDSEGLNLHSSARTKAAVSTVAFVAGASALAVGAVLWFTADTGKGDSVAVGFGPGAAFVRGSFQ